MTTPADRTTGISSLTYDECRACGRRWALPRTGCPECGTPEPRRRTATGRGSVMAVTVVHPPADEPYSLVLVDLEEGVRVMGRAEDGVTIGTGVRAGFADGVPTFVGPDPTP